MTAQPTLPHSHPTRHPSPVTRSEYLYEYYCSLGDAAEQQPPKAGDKPGDAAGDTEGGRQRRRLAAFMAAVGVDTEAAEADRRRRQGMVRPCVVRVGPYC